MAKDKTEKKAKSSKSNSGTLYDVKVPGQGFITLEGDLVDVMGDSMVIRHRRSGSSKWQHRTVAKKNVIVMPADGVGKFVISGTQNAIRLRKATVEGPDKNNPGFIRVEDEKGPMLIRSEFMDAVTVTDIDAPSGSSEKKKKKASASK